MRRVAVVGVEQTPYVSAHKEWSLEELIFRTVRSLLQKVGVGIEDIDSAVISSSDQVDGRAISIMVTSGSVGGYAKDLLNAPSSGEHALALAFLRVASGMFDTSLVVGWNKCSEPEDMSNIQNLTADYIYHRDIGMNDVVSHALQAGVYVKNYGVSENAATRVVLKNRSNGTRNSHAHLREGISLASAESAPLVAWPLRMSHLPPESDGVCALLLASEDKVKSLASGAVAWIKGLSWVTDSYWMGDRRLHALSSLELAATRAYRMARIDKPADELDVVELHEVSAYHELMAYEALGLCGPGEAHRLVEDGATEFHGPIPVNPSGGALCANPYFATGLVRLAEAALQVMGSAGDHQVDGAQVSLASANCGFACQGGSAFIFSSRAD